ncbi:MAG: hypothetical protein AB7O32_08075 [Vicinamibacterales bacterium]
MVMTRTFGWGMMGAATTLAARMVTRKMLHQRNGAPRLPRRTRKSTSLSTMLMLAAATGALLAIGDVLQEQRKHLTDAA